MRTLVGAAASEPSDMSRWPRVMIVDSSASQRVAWHEQCQQMRVRHHFVGTTSATSRLQQGFSVAGVILDRDMESDLYPFLVTKDQHDFTKKLVKLGYAGPLVGANLLPLGGLQVLLRDVADQTGCPLLLDGEPKSVEYSEMLDWCVKS